MTPDASGTIIDTVGVLATVFDLADGSYVLTARASLTGDPGMASRVICDLIASPSVFDESIVDVAAGGEGEISLLAAVSLSGGPTDIDMECSTDVGSVEVFNLQMMAIRVGSVTITGP